MFETGRHPGDLVDPLQEITAKEKPELVQVLGEYKTIVFHRLASCTENAEGIEEIIQICSNIFTCRVSKSYRYL
jgi:hypothetical protein